MILADDVGQVGGAQPVGKRTRRLAIEAGGGEQAWTLLRALAHLIRHARRPSPLPLCGR